MNMAGRRCFLNTPILRNIYLMTRKAYNRRRFFRAAENYFVNFRDYRKALDEVEEGRLAEIQTKETS